MYVSKREYSVINSDILNTRFVQKVSGLTTVHEVGKAYGVLTLIVFNIFPSADTHFA